MKVIVHAGMRIEAVVFDVESVVPESVLPLVLRCAVTAIFSRPHWGHFVRRPPLVVFIFVKKELLRLALITSEEVWDSGKILVSDKFQVHMGSGAP